MSPVVNSRAITVLRRARTCSSVHSWGANARTAASMRAVMAEPAFSHTISSIVRAQMSSFHVSGCQLASMGAASNAARRSMPAASARSIIR